MNSQCINPPDAALLPPRGGCAPPLPTLGIIGGGRNAGLLAVQILATADDALRERVVKFKSRLAAESRKKNDGLSAETAKFLQV